MKSATTERRLVATLAGIVIAVAFAACSSVTEDTRQDGTVSGPPAPSTPTSEPSTAPAAIEEAKIDEMERNEEIVVTATRMRRPARREQRRLAESADVAAGIVAPAAFAQQAALDDAATLARIQPGEEVWVIAQPGRAPQPPAPPEPPQPPLPPSDMDTPGSGAMLASLVWPDDVPPQDRHSREIPLPLQHTAVDAQINGYVGTVDVTQQFANPFDQKIEAVYLFPLPEKAAVNEFVMTIGERRIRGILREKEQAEQIYAQARAQGHQASLLTQHRPNVFEQKVANIEPGHRIDVEIRYFHTLRFEDGWYSFVFPTVIGPRYNPPGSNDGIAALPRNNLPAHTAAVHYLAPNERSGHDISIAVDVAPGVGIEEIDASHDIVRQRISDQQASVRLADRAMIPNRDFELRFRVAGEQIKSSLLTWVDPDTNEGYFTMMMYPPADLQNLQRQPLELVFVLDCSGSMSGIPMEQSKSAIIAALDELRPDDTFQIIRFSNNASAFGPEPVAATQDNIREAKRFVRRLSGTGGTQMIEGIKAALDFPHDDSRLRFVTFLTDGYIGNEAEILGAIHERLGASRIFSFGVGSSPNRYLLERMAGIGRGAVAWLGPQDSGAQVMDHFFDRISHPAMIDVGIDWNGMRVSDVYPSRLPDLFVGRSVVVTGRFTGLPAAPTVRGRAAGERVAVEVERSEETDDFAFIAPTWARLRIADLMDRRTWASDPAEVAEEIRRTALQHSLMSDYTAFVAVDAATTTSGSQGTTVFQAVPVPDGVRYGTTVHR